jgi:hypothetical protein
MSAEEIVTPAPLTKWEREYRAFRRLLPELLKTHKGRYVAVHDENVVDSDSDDIALIQRVHAKYGYVPIHVELVAERAQVVRIPHYRVYEESVTLPVPNAELTSEPCTKWEREYQAFRKLLPELMKTHKGQYVAVHEGKVIDSGDNRLELVFRALAQAGNVDIHVGLVTDQTEPVSRSGVRREVHQDKGA